MRFRHVCSTLAVTAIVAACDPKANDMKASDDTKADSGKTPAADTLEAAPRGNPPSIRLVCGPNTVRFAINAWRYTVEDKDAEVTWQLPESAGNADSVMINPRDPAKWPLEGPLPIVIKKGVPSGRRPTPSPGSTLTPFNYTITGVCGGNGPNAADTVVIDPILILPR